MEEIYYQVITIVFLLITTYVKASATPTYNSFKEKLSYASTLATEISDLIREITKALDDNELDKEELRRILSKLEGVAVSLRVFLT
ncbi:hypothetical protein KAR91_44420 [Candidatus Pacearchaeota archaeon]|nr:hypothetical protein [Candidatus Pacearchaeota archaeon]